MSPPCQPFTRQGNQKDVGDNRTDALVHLCSIVGQLAQVDTILMENVKGFEGSRARDMYVEALQAAGYHYAEMILSPSQLGIPNTRYRYYCLARKRAAFPFGSDAMIEQFPSSSSSVGGDFGSTVRDYLDDNDDGGELLPDTLLAKRAKVLDIACAESQRTICFTKAYTHYTEGTGSVYCPKTRPEVEATFDQVKLMPNDDSSDEVLQLVKSLRMRYFSPAEVARLMCFPSERDDDAFTFPSVTTRKQRYRLLGNSINVLVVSELIKLLFVDDDEDDSVNRFEDDD